ncbi:hypothetical protein [Pseudomonas moorei]|uniref:Uncharacterized protein n=1 Tax=Pseudomonas moorei TaxID=395599 RepID=A0A1H1FK49_9PSED|nr:hypothetical protein [Pseudomonas moorei]KAB0509643.1 hypothetical protein F7R06_01080 [Pseudomonas moorei]SDR01453.1 hypothetical protein SAMN04490195_2754 [Pseudomonas moorei]
MNALAAAQSRWDNITPVDTSSRDEAADEWAYNAAEQLVLGCDVVIRTRRQTKMISYADFLGNVQAQLNQRQIEGEDDEDNFAQLVIAALKGGTGKSFAEKLLGPHGLQEIALELVSPWFDLAMEQVAEDDDS